MGTGRVRALTPPRYRYSGRPNASAAARAADLESVEAAVILYEEINGEYQTLVAEMSQMRRRLDDYAIQAAEMRERARHWAVEAYIAGATRDGELLVVDVGSMQKAMLTREVFADAAADELAELEDLEAIAALQVMGGAKLLAHLENPQGRNADSKRPGLIVHPGGYLRTCPIGDQRTGPGSRRDQ